MSKIVYETEVNELKKKLAIAKIKQGLCERFFFNILRDITSDSTIESLIEETRKLLL